VATIRRKHIQTLVDRLLMNQRVKSAPVPVDDIAKKIGAEIRYEPADDELSGFLFRDRGQRRVIIGVNSNHHPNRQRFTVAHEIGHFLLHEYEGFHFDGKDQGFQVKRRDDKSSKGTNTEEIEANLFASELLMPARFLEADLSKVSAVDLLDENNLDSFTELATRYAVSTQALTFRLAKLGYVQL
jgi:Zn-dependent peptidase ImmA (M78 family)